MSYFSPDKQGGPGIFVRGDVKGLIVRGNVTGFPFVTVWFLNEQCVYFVFVCV
jgi:hypothetical protein